MNNKDKILKIRTDKTKPRVKTPNQKTVTQRAKTLKPAPQSVINIPDSEKEIKADHPQLTDIMEVHHHPQLYHKPKPWKEYLLEGFMIFLAVMMGFIAENIREAIDNHEHVRQLTSQLVHDLKADTAQLNKIALAEIKIAQSNDALITLLQQPFSKADTRHIQKQVANSHSLWLFHPSAGAIAAIKSELHLKQFSNSKIISFFATYEKDTELLHTAQDVSLQYQRLYLDPFLTQHFTPANMVAAFDSHAVPTAQMRNLSQADLDQLAAEMVLIRLVSNEMVTDNRQVEDDAVKLLKYVKKQYSLEDE
jgi:hypothetical protein